MPADDLPAIPAPFPGDYGRGRRVSLCSEALAPALAALADQAEAAGWTSRDVAAACICWGTGRAFATDGPDATRETLMLAFDTLRMWEHSG